MYTVLRTCEVLPRWGGEIGLENGVVGRGLFQCLLVSSEVCYLGFGI